MMAACAAQTQMPHADIAVVQAHYRNMPVALKVSCYYGDLYDENEKWLLSPYPFAETSHLVDLHGAPIHPQGERGIIPAGTHFVIESVEFPTVTVMAGRMLTTPRFNPWVYLQAALDDHVPGSERSVYILLLSMDIKTEAEADAALDKILGRPKDVQSWLASRTEPVQVAIKHKSAVPNMSWDEMVAALGEPPHLFAETTSAGRAVVAWYPTRELWLYDKVVKQIQAARAISAPAPTKPADANAPAPKK